MESIKLGTQVFVFDIEATEPKVRKDVVVGAFINMETGDLWYYLSQNKAPAYAVSEVEFEIHKSLKRFLEFRGVLKDAQDEIDGLKFALNAPFNGKEFIEKAFAELHPAPVEQQEEVISETQEPANE